MKSLKVILYLSLFISFISCSKEESPFEEQEIVDDGIDFSLIWGTFRDVNHRGYCTIAPENTLPAFALSKEKGFKIIETDLFYSKDGVPVLIHDASVDRTSNGKGDVDKLTYEQLRTLDFGSWKSELYAGTVIPNLEEFVSFCKDNEMKMYLELKADMKAVEKAVVDLLVYGSDQHYRVCLLQNGREAVAINSVADLIFGVLD